MREKEIDVLIVRTWKEPERAVIPNKLEVFQEIVDGYIEVYSPWKEKVAFIIDEEGKCKNKKLNRAIIDKQNEKVEICDVIAGDFIIVGIKDDEFVSLTEEQMKRYESKFQFPEFYFDESYLELII